MPRIARFWWMLLATAEMVPVSVDSGCAALEALVTAERNGAPIPIVVIDVCMPETDAFETVTRIRDRVELNSEKIILLTPAGERGDGIRCLQLGVHAYLMKPTKQSELLPAIYSALQDDGSKKVELMWHTFRENQDFLRVLVAQDNS